MFRITDIRNIAIQIEKNGEASYRQAADSVKDPKIQEILEWMANEERRHRKWFEAIESNQSVPPEQEELEKMGKSLLQDMVANQTFSLDQKRLDQTETVAELLAQSKAFEEDTILFYEFLLALIEDEATARELKIIIEEERQHAIRLEELVEACA
ncbi:ferritin family protein [Desulfosediminicola flagellatus]|uniref:ferritin family protein n=1 Tax=Desulfosediminicola flagellatus TaxID=2569541 RepID=UPI0010AD91E7|nr:ferritin family protein [Desulfosediminicola flagellatus]